jgi:hypothetical protein
MPVLFHFALVSFFMQWTMGVSIRKNRPFFQFDRFSLLNHFLIDGADVANRVHLVEETELGDD